MSYQTGLIEFAAVEAAKRAKARVVFVDGWRTRGSSTFNPQGVVDHHDASSTGSGDAGALNTIIHGRSDLPGPLGNYQLGRDGTIYVVAAGRANHAGSGGWRGLTGNSSVIGIEAANNGIGEPWPDSQMLSYRWLNYFLVQGLRKSEEMICAHKEWAPTRKPDPRGAPWNDMDAYRHSVADLPYVTTQQEDDLKQDERQWLAEIHTAAMQTRKMVEQTRNAAGRIEKAMSDLTLMHDAYASGDAATAQQIAQEVRRELAQALSELGE